MNKPIDIAVVGHTNAGKTSLLRTLTRRASFGEVSERPGTTRHVELIDLKINGVSAVRFFDTPGLEDSVALLDYLKALDNCVTPPDRIRAMLAGPEAQRSFEQEAKVLRKMLEVDAAVYVIDTREAVLPKFRAEIEILSSCAKPVMPVLNFVRHPDSRKSEWIDTLSAYGLHAYVQFDAVAPFVGSEQDLYQSLAILLRDRREQLEEVIEDLELQFMERRSAACELIAETLVDLAAMRHQITKEDFDIPRTKQKFVLEFQHAVLQKVRRCIDNQLDIYGFRKEDADDAVLPWLDGRWQTDLFSAETLRDASVKLGTGASVGAAVGLAVDIALAGLSLGTGTAIGAAIGGVASQGWGQIGRTLSNKARGIQELTLENEVLLIVAENGLNLLLALEQRGHAASGKITGQALADEGATERLRRAIALVQPARNHPEWEADAKGRHPSSGQRARLVQAVGEAVRDVLA